MEFLKDGLRLMFLTRLSEEQAIVIKIDHSLHWSVKCCGREVSCNEIEQACEKIANYDLMKSLLAKLRLSTPALESGLKISMRSYITIKKQ